MLNAEAFIVYTYAHLASKRIQKCIVNTRYYLILDKAKSSVGIVDSFVHTNTFLIAVTKLITISR